MNTLVEKGFGIIIFIGFFIPFTLGLYFSANKGYEFNNVTNELTQMVKEDGEIYGKTLSADKKKEIYQKEYDSVLASTNDKTKAREAGIKKLNTELKANEEASSSVYNYLNSTTANSDKSLSDMGYSSKIEIKVDDVDNGLNVLQKMLDDKKVVNLTKYNTTDSNKLVKNDIVSIDLSQTSLDKIKIKTGATVTIKYDYEKELRFGWTPHYVREAKVTIYKR